MRTIFVDASAWIAIIYEKDKNHNIASKIYRKEIVNAQLVTTNWTAYEAYTYVKTRTDIEKAILLRKTIENKQFVKLERITKFIEEKAIDKFWRYRDKKWGIIDITSFEIMEKISCTLAFGFDRHFVEAAKQNGFELLTP
ncbi:MAG: PIN domain-containing protein [Deltaproteobacteria bacterium]|nr:PIN domain-containing protein [Deltaproteobacteria bacterium]